MSNLIINKNNDILLLSADFYFRAINLIAFKKR